MDTEPLNASDISKAIAGVYADRAESVLEVFDQNCKQSLKDSKRILLGVLKFEETNMWVHSVRFHCGWGEFLTVEENRQPVLASKKRKFEELAKSESALLSKFKGRFTKTKSTVMSLNEALAKNAQQMKKLHMDFVADFSALRTPMY
ncbi:hypothetical protein HK101_006196 [Irineochytrium annulatum]|nr:hypothetical protein HK101_006196 [Irineochytrium annulatum]